MQTEYIKLLAMFSIHCSPRIWSYAQVLITGAILVRGQRTVTTIEDMIAQIDEDRRFARERGHSAAALAASMGKAKLLGFLAEQPAVELNFNCAAMTEEEIRCEMAAIHEQARALKRGPLIDH